MSLVTKGQAFDLATIDFEGSALRGYPIEVGIATWCRETNTITTWSTLIKPIGYWRDRPNKWWDPKSQALHGISPSDLETGISPRNVMTSLNAQLGSSEVYCDGGTFDIMYLYHLRDAAGIEPTFRLAGLRAFYVAAGLDGAGWRTATDHLQASDGQVRHRAGQDAARLLRAALVAGGHDPITVHEAAERPRAVMPNETP